MDNDTQAQERAQLADINQKPLGTRLGFYAKKSGPGWLQGAITLGGGSLAGALYLGVISGFHLMWLQPLAMICGVIMLSAIAYVTLSTEERPFGLINRNLSPALGWAWIIATIMANIVWCMPQFNLGRAAIQQNIMPSVGESTESTIVICVVLLAIAIFVNRLYQSESGGAKLFDRILKVMVGLIVLSFIAVVFTLTANGAVPWGNLFSGFIPNLSYLSNPAPAYVDLIASSSDPQHWTDTINSSQRDIIITAFATAVGINMTFLLPYSMLKKCWGTVHRPLAIFDLSVGLFIPFFIATACVVIAAASQFHASTADVLDANGQPIAKVAGAYEKALEKLEAANDSDKQLAAMLIKRDNFQLANALEPLAGKAISQKIFGFGVLGMALSTIIILMLINGLAFQELFKEPNSKGVHFAGCLVAGLAGLAGPFLWGNAEARAALAIPTSVIGGSLIPIAYITFLLLMNSKAVLGDKRPRGISRLIWNALMIFATSIATYGSIWVLLGKSKAPGFPGIAAIAGLYILVILVVLGVLGFLKNERKAGGC